MSLQNTVVMSPEWVPANKELSKRLLDQHDVVIDALGGSLLHFPFDLSQENLKILESGCADGRTSSVFWTIS
jgi:hypothetical protein